MTLTLLIGGAVAALALGIWIGIGAPGWPYHDDSRGRRHTEKRPINPIAWGRTPSRERLRVKRPEERRPRVR